MNANRGMFGYEGEGFDQVSEEDVRRGHPRDGWNIGRADDTRRPDEKTGTDEVPGSEPGTPRD